MSASQRVLALILVHKHFRMTVSHTRQKLLKIMLQPIKTLRYLWCRASAVSTVWFAWFFWSLRPCVRPSGCKGLEQCKLCVSVDALEEMWERERETQSLALSLSLSISLPILKINREHVASPMMQHTEDHSTEKWGEETSDKGRRRREENKKKRKSWVWLKKRCVYVRGCLSCMCVCVHLILESRTLQLWVGEREPWNYSCFWEHADKMGINSSKSERKNPPLNIQLRHQMTPYQLTDILPHTHARTQIHTYT